MIALFFSSFVIGIAFCAPPGIVTAETIRRGLARGFRAAFLLQLGSLVGDTTWAIIALTGLNILIQNRVAFLSISILGFALLAYLSWSAFKDAYRAAELQNLAASEKGDMLTGILLSLSNPFAVVFWLGIGTSVFSGYSSKIETMQYATFFGGFLSGTLLWCFFIAGLVAWGRRFMTATFFRWVNLTCGLALAYFSLNLMLRIILEMK